MKKIYFLILLGLGMPFLNAQYQKHIISTSNDAGAYGLWIKDVNNDGILDLLGASVDDNSLLYFLNDGNGNFTQHLITDTFTGAKSIDAADFTGNNLTDFAACGSNELAWFENTGSGYNKHSVATGLVDPTQVRVSDVGTILDPGTPDGDIDIGVLKTGENSVSLYLNDGSNAFSNLNLISINSPKFLHGGDFNSDNTDDLLISSYGNNEVVWYKVGSLGFVQGGTVATGFNGAFGVEGGDIDLDGDDDVVATAFLDNEVAWFENTDGTGNNFVKHTIDSNLYGASYIHWLDIDGDGDKDLVVAAYGTFSSSTVIGSQMVIYYNDGSQNFTKTIIDNTELGPANFVVYDFNNDGAYDIAYAASISGKYVLLLADTSSIHPTEFAHLKIYPNPATGFINITADMPIEKVQIFDITGRKVLETAQKHITVQNYPPGYYLVKVNLANGKEVTKKVVLK